MPRAFNFPKGDKMTACKECMGTGTIDCDNCGGSGECECDMGFDHPCEECEDGQRECDNCDGTGKVD